jgi:hypothetical protein
MSSTTISIPAISRFKHLRLSCLLLGHQAVDRCDCQSAAFVEDGTLTHIRHVLSCFLGGIISPHLRAANLITNMYVTHAATSF